MEILTRLIIEFLRFIFRSKPGIVLETLLVGFETVDSAELFSIKLWTHSGGLSEIPGNMFAAGKMKASGDHIDGKIGFN